MRYVVITSRNGGGQYPGRTDGPYPSKLKALKQVEGLTAMGYRARSALYTPGMKRALCRAINKRQRFASAELIASLRRR